MILHPTADCWWMAGDVWRVCEHGFAKRILAEEIVRICCQCLIAVTPLIIVCDCRTL